MDIRSFLKRRKYFLRIYIFISATIIVLIAVYSSVSYSRIRTKFFDDEVNNGIKILIQMKNNIQSIDSIVRETCISFFYDYDIRALMFLRKEDAYLESHVQTQLMRSISVNDFIHSIYVYNNNRKIYFSTSDPFYHSDISLDETLMSLPSIPVLKPILRNIETTGTDGREMTQQVITYCYFEQTDTNGKMGGAIIVNIKIDWILNNIYEIGEVDNRKTDDFFLVNSYGDVINAKNIDEQFDIEMQDIINSFKTGDANGKSDIIGTSTRVIKDKKFLFSYIEIQQGNFVLFNVNSYDDIYSLADDFLILFFFMTLLFLLVGFAAAVGISYFIYRPVTGVLDHVRSRYDPSDIKNEPTDEISFIKETISYSVEKIEELNQEKHTNTRIMKSYFLKRLLLESLSIGMDELREKFSEYGILFDPEGDYAVLILKIDKFREIKNDLCQTDSRLTIKKIMDHIFKIVSAAFKCEVLDTLEDQFTLILNFDNEESGYFSKMNDVFEQLNNYVFHLHGFTFTASVSEIVKSYAEIVNINNKAESNLIYRFVLGRKTLITPAKAANNNRLLGSDRDLENEEGFFKAILEENWQQARESLAKLFDELKYINCIGVVFYATHLKNEFRNLIFRINEKRDTPINAGNILSGEGFLEAETLSDLFNQFSSLLEEFESCGESTADRRHKMLAETIKDIIVNNYQDPDLNITFIEDLVKLSPSYIGKHFNSHFKMSIPEYVNDIRMSKALEWLSNSKLSINQVMLKVGIENQSYFYRLFRNKYGCSPREFINKMQEQITD